ncbi:2-polyprenyl-3-methyl-6-methoxy-1,4-benzoquinone monooxygenase [Xanthomonadaceae bacterium JHOS43]|nr:2-polyprenyl-3-methyl-6-methoxy-1,4-benzoquinone monooxygenase [Xanthomonadaceae bacterium JHOS43]
MSLTRHYSPLDRVLMRLDHALASSVAGIAAAQRPNPASELEEAEMDVSQRRHAAGLMRINHTGEVCAQALYVGQAAVARDPATRTHLEHAAQEEADHLAWCHERLIELGARPSLFNPFWYAASYTLGAVAGWRGDGWNLGFVVETERQVEAHLDEHLETLPPQDARSRAILALMKDDEVRHADNAQAAGARVLPEPIPSAMRLMSRVMKTVAYRI